MKETVNILKYLEEVYAPTDDPALEIKNDSEMILTVKLERGKKQYFKGGFQRTRTESKQDYKVIYQ